MCQTKAIRWSCSTLVNSVVYKSDEVVLYLNVSKLMKVERDYQT